jgi:hypothetical protein
MQPGSRGAVILYPDDAWSDSHSVPLMTSDVTARNATTYTLMIYVGVFSEADFDAYYKKLATIFYNAPEIPIPLPWSTNKDGYYTAAKVPRDFLNVALLHDSRFFKIRKCSTCGKMKCKMKRCERCTAHYCDRLCQKCDWPEHKDQCDAMNSFLFSNPNYKWPRYARRALYERAPMCPGYEIVSAYSACLMIHNIRQFKEALGHNVTQHVVGA